MARCSSSQRRHSRVVGWLPVPKARPGSSRRLIASRSGASHQVGTIHSRAAIAIGSNCDCVRRTQSCVFHGVQRCIGFDSGGDADGGRNAEHVRTGREQRLTTLSAHSAAGSDPVRRTRVARRRCRPRHRSHPPTSAPASSSASEMRSARPAGTRRLTRCQAIDAAFGAQSPLLGQSELVLEIVDAGAAAR